MKLDNLLFLKTRNKEELTIEMIYENVELNNETFLNRSLEQNGLIDEYKTNFANIVFDTYFNEHKNEEYLSNSKHGVIWKSHFWAAVGIHAMSSYLIITATIFCWAAQISLSIAKFVSTLDGVALAENLASFNFNVPTWFVSLIQKTITIIKDFKKKTNCNWKYVVWNRGGYLITI